MQLLQIGSVKPVLDSRSFVHLLVLEVLLVDHVFNLTHAFRFVHAVLLPLLVPAPFVDLRFGEASLDREHEQSLLGPVGIVLECVVQRVDLPVALALALLPRNLPVLVLVIMFIHAELMSLLEPLNLSDVVFVHLVAVVRNLVQRLGHVLVKCVVELTLHLLLLLIEDFRVDRFES